MSLEDVKRFNRPLFITLEGIDGSGKTSVSIPVLQWLNEATKRNTVFTHEPYGAWEKKIKEAKSDSNDYPLFLEQRTAHVEQIIRPHLEAGDNILCDRYIDSTWAYQVNAKKAVSYEQFEADARKYEFPEPDYTVYLRIPVEISLERVHKRGNPDWYDVCGASFMTRVASGYDYLAKLHPRFLVVDAAVGIQEVADNVIKGLSARFKADGLWRNRE